MNVPYYDSIGRNYFLTDFFVATSEHVDKFDVNCLSSSFSNYNFTTNSSSANFSSYRFTFYHLTITVGDFEAYIDSK